MVPFLKSVARDLREKYGRDMSDIVVVFPNKRASLFLDTYLAEIEHEAIWSPSYITISELFRQNSPLKVADPIKLVCDLHKSFVKCTEIDETLDHFTVGVRCSLPILTILIKIWQMRNWCSPT